MVELKCKLCRAYTTVEAIYRRVRDMFTILRWILGSSHKRTLSLQANYQKPENQGSMSKVGVRIIHGNIGILSEFRKRQGAYYTWGRIIHGNLR